MDHRFQLIGLSSICALLAGLACHVVGAAAPAAPAAAGARIVFLGDSITDGNTYPLVVQQAIREAGLPVPQCFNAGIGGDTSEGMVKRLDRDVFRHQPTMVTISAGVNDRLAADVFAKNMTTIVDAVQAKGAEAVLLTTSIQKDKSPETQKRLDGYNQIIRDLAEKRHLRLAEVYRLMDAQSDAIARQMTEDGVHPNFVGQRTIATAVLAALGHASLPVPKTLKLQVFPGVVRQWHMRPAKADEPSLTDALAAGFSLEGCTATINIPGDSPAGDPATWSVQERQCGFAAELDKQVGSGDRFFGLASVKAAKATPAVLNTGAGLKTVYLNGKRVYTNTAWTGWHAFKEQIPVSLVEGENKLVIESGTAFFLSITDAQGKEVVAMAPVYPADVRDVMHDGTGRTAMGWLDRHKKHMELARTGEVQVYFAGDSITDGWQTSGQAAWKKYFEPLKPGNFGIYGEETQHVAWRLHNGGLDGVKAKVAVLMIGTNNLGAHPDMSPEEVARGVMMCVQEFRDHVPGIKVLVLGILPRGEGPTNEIRRRAVAVNKILEAKADNKEVFYLDIGAKFLRADGSVDPVLVPDLSHPSQQGYEVFGQAVAPVVRKLLQ